MFADPQKVYNITKRIRTPEQVEKYFPGFLTFIDCIEQQQIPRPADNKRKKEKFLFRQKEKTYC
jgi:hypothetical protein